MTVTEITNRTHGCRRTATCHVCVPAHLSCTGEAYWTDKEVDLCFADVVDALNEVGILTASCCCGHGVGSGSIILHNGITLEVPKCEVKDHSKTFSIQGTLTGRQRCSQN